MEFTIDYLEKQANEDDYIELMESYLVNGGDIDVFIISEHYERITILLRAISIERAKIVEYALGKDADIGKEVYLYHTDVPERFYADRYWNALELVVLKRSFGVQKTHESQCSERIFDMVVGKSLEKFASRGIHPVHLECALGRWSNVVDLCNLDSTIVNRTIDADCSIWPGMTPLLVAAKFNQQRVVQGLLDRGASPKARDPRGNTPLHYLSTHDFYDDRLFVFDDDEDSTFGSLNGMSHFHIACHFRALKAVKKYLERGVSPNVEIKKREYNRRYMYKSGATGLSIAAQRAYDKTASPDLARLLFEYGAKVKPLKREAKEDLDKSLYLHRHDSSSTEDSNRVEVACLVLELEPRIGTCAEENKYTKTFVKRMRASGVGKSIFLRCVERLLALVSERRRVSDELRNHYKAVLRDTPDFDELAYSELCNDELKRLENAGLRKEFEDHEGTVIIGRDFRRKFGSLVDSMDVEYPVYGHVLKMKVRHRLRKFDERQEKMDKAVPGIVRTVESYCVLPVICAEEILSNFKNEDIDKFIQDFNKMCS